MAVSKPEYTGLAKLIDDYVVALVPFWDLAKDEIRKNNSSDFDNLEFLLNAAMDRHAEFANTTYEIYGEDSLK